MGGSSFCILKKEQPKYETTSTSIIPTNKISFLPHLKPNTGVNLHHCFPSLTSPNRTFLKTFLVQLVLLIVANHHLQPCLAQNQIEPEDYQIYSDGESDVAPSDLERLYQLYDDTSTTSDTFNQDLSRISDQEEEDGKETQLLGCLFSNEVCNEDEICFDDLILGRCISDDSEIDVDEGLQPLSTDDQSVLDVEVERLLEQGFRWDDPYFQCVIQTLIGSFRYYGLEYDTTLCKAAFLPELSIERRVDVPKKFILPDGDIDSTNNQNFDVFDDEGSIEKVKGEEDGENQPYLTSTKNTKRS